MKCRACGVHNCVRKEIIKFLEWAEDEWAEYFDTEIVDYYFEDCIDEHRDCNIVCALKI